MSFLARHAKNMQKDLRLKRSGMPETTRTHFITFTNTGYMAPTRILHEAESFGFDTVRAFTEYDIPEFIETHRAFIDQHSHGYGHWIWKPKIILDTLKSVPDNDIVIYCDAGMHLNKGGLSRYYDYLGMLQSPTTSAVVFSGGPFYKAQEYVKMDAVLAYAPGFAADSTITCYAGVMMLRKTSDTLALVQDWLALCETYHFLDGSVSRAPELPIFKGNDCDNGLFNLCLYRNKTHAVIPHVETNIYNNEGHQLHMTATDWSSLDHFPFQCRRLRPR
jgi:hypothetical protein